MGAGLPQGRGRRRALPGHGQAQPGDHHHGGGQEEVIEADGGINFRNNIRSLWINQMSNENKEIIWKYFKIFVLLIEKYILENITPSSNQSISR